MTSSKELYLSSNTTFAAAFESQPKLFLHPNLRDLERQLCDWGLISNFTGSSFKACALAINNSINRKGILERALTVFRAYNKFIPRLMNSTRYGSIPTDNYLSLPEIVSPSQIVDPRFAGIVWTQRGTCREEPSLQLLKVNGSVWEPTASEVVEHLYILSTDIALKPELRSNRELIADLKATYSWLAQHEGETGELENHNQDKLFLNVDDPASEWTWKSASELLFDERGTSNTRRVRRFLQSYSGLLRAAGVREITHVDIPEKPRSRYSHETQLTRIRDKVDSMREEDKWTDVILVAKDGAKFPAHRVFLAVQSGHFETRAGGLGEPRVSSETQVNCGRECLGAVLDWMYKGSYNLSVEESKRLDVLEEMYRLAYSWDLVDSDLFDGLTHELIKSIGTETYKDLRKLAGDLRLEGGQLAKKCEEFERKNRMIFAEGL